MAHPENKGERFPLVFPTVPHLDRAQRKSGFGSSTHRRGGLRRAHLACTVLKLPAWGGLRLIRRLPRVFLYLFYLFGQVVVSNLQVIERILFPQKRKGGGRLVWFRTDLKEEGTRLTLANSITLTPGTVTVSLKGNYLCVHALDEDFAKGVKENGFAPRLERWEGGDHG